MNLSNKTSDLKLYSRGKYSDGLPHTSNDIHQEQDLTLRKLGLILNTTIGSSLLENALFNSNVKDSDTLSVRLSKPITVNLNGEIFLIGNSEGLYPLEIPRTLTGSIVLVCWYTNVTANSTIYEYGGLCNNTMLNDITDEKLGIQTSSRYQIRWNLGYCAETFDYSNPSIKTITLLNSMLTENGFYTNLLLNSANMSLTGKFYTVPATSRLKSEDGLIHLLPLASVNNSVITPYNVQLNLSSIESTTPPSPNPHKVWYNPNTEDIKMYFNGAWRNVGGSVVLKSETEPTENVKDGNIWYNPVLDEFKIYVDGVGFLGTYAKMGFVQLQSSHLFNEDIVTPQNITLPIPIDTYLSSDLLRISYEGLELIKGTNYTLNEINKTITLTDFTVNSGDTLVFTVTRLVGSSDLMTTLNLLENHINDLGNNTAAGHIKLTDTPAEQLDQSSGVAATPKSVKEVDNKINKYIDQVTEKVYEMGVNNGLLFIREVTN